MTTTAGHSERSAESTTASLGMILFLAAEAMFFLGLLSALTVIGPAHGGVFRRSAAEMSKTLTAASVLCLVAMSAAAYRRPWPINWRWTGLAIGLVFLGLQGLQCTRLLRHETVIGPVDGTPRILDGVVKQSGGSLIVTGNQFDLPDHFDPHEVQLPPGGRSGTFTTPAKMLVYRQSYGPGRSNFFSCCFVLTGVHAAHLVGGMIALAVVSVRRRPRIPAVTLYWHTMNAIGIVCLAALWAV